MESSRQAAREAIQETIAKLKAVVPNSKLDAPLSLDAVTPYEQTFQSTFGREVRTVVPTKSSNVIKYECVLCSCGLLVCMLFTIGQWYIIFLTPAVFAILICVMLAGPRNHRRTRPSRYIHSIQHVIDFTRA